MFLPEKVLCVRKQHNSTYECIFISSSWDLPLWTVGGWWVVLLVQSSKQISSTSFGNLSHLKLSGHVKPKRFIRSPQPSLPLLQRERQGGTGVFNTVQIGAYTEQRNNAKSLEQPSFTKRKNWCISSAASSCDLWLNIFGNLVVLYTRPWQSGIVSGSHICWPWQGNTKLSPQIAPRTRNRPTFAPTTVVNISALIRTMSSETLSSARNNLSTRSLTTHTVTRVGHVNQSMLSDWWQPSQSKHLEIEMGKVGAEFNVPTLHGIYPHL